MAFRQIPLLKELMKVVCVCANMKWNLGEKEYIKHVQTDDAVANLWMCSKVENFGMKLSPLCV